MLRSIRLVPVLVAALLLVGAPASANAATLSSLMAPASFFNALLPGSATLNVLDTALAGPYLTAEALRAPPGLNTTKYSAATYTVPTTQPLVPVRLRMPSGGATPPYAKALEAVMRTGLPIPAGYAPQGDTDDIGAFWMPGWTGTQSDGTVLHGRIYEAWRLRPNTDPSTPNIAWEAQWGGRLSGVAESKGHYIDRYTTYRDRAYPALPTDPVKADLFEEKGWGAMATSIPIQPTLIKAADVQAGVIRNAMGLNVSKPGPGWRWPAQRSDGALTSLNPIQEGMRLRLPANYVAPSNLNPFVQMVIAAARDYGFVVTDHAANLAIRAEPAVSSLLPVPAYAALYGFPWGSLQVMATGSDTNPTP
jgi:hypothetical protein